MPTRANDRKASVGSSLEPCQNSLPLPGPRRRDDVHEGPASRQCNPLTSGFATLTALLWKSSCGRSDAVPILAHAPRGRFVEGPTLQRRTVHAFRASLPGSAWAAPRKPRAVAPQDAHRFPGGRRVPLPDASGERPKRVAPTQPPSDHHGVSWSTSLDPQLWRMLWITVVSRTSTRPHACAAARKAGRHDAGSPRGDRTARGRINGAGCVDHGS